MTKPDAILFDLDGTLWDSTEGIYDALMSLEDEFPEGTPPITKEKLDSCMGLPMDEISKRLFPTASEEEREEIMNRFTQRELSHLLRVGGKLYPCIESVLNDLSRDFPLFIVSNCQQGILRLSQNTINSVNTLRTFYLGEIRSVRKVKTCNSWQKSTNSISPSMSETQKAMKQPQDKQA